MYLSQVTSLVSLLLTSDIHTKESSRSSRTTIRLIWYGSIRRRDSRLNGGAASCLSIHVGEIRPGGLRENHIHHTCNEMFVIWGAKTKFRLESHKAGKGYAEVVIGEDEVAVAVSPSGTVHALVNVDSVRSTFFIDCQNSDMPEQLK